MTKNERQIALTMNKLQKRKFAKLISLSTIYFADPEWDNDIYEFSKKYAYNEISKMKIPNGWHLISGYQELKQLFLDNCC